MRSAGVKINLQLFPSQRPEPAEMCWGHSGVGYENSVPQMPLATAPFFRGAYRRTLECALRIADQENYLQRRKQIQEEKVAGMRSIMSSAGSQDCIAPHLLFMEIVPLCCPMHLAPTPGTGSTLLSDALKFWWLDQRCLALRVTPRS